METFKLLTYTEETDEKILVNELSAVYETKRSFNLHAAKCNKSLNLGSENF